MRSTGYRIIAAARCPGGGTLQQTEQASTQQALPEAVILEQAQLGQRVEALYGAPQDLEWGWPEGRLYLLQARPITTLYPALSRARPAR